MGVALEYDNDFFDCVIDSACVCANLYSNIGKMYEEIFRVLKKGGKMYSTCFGTKTDGYMTGTCLEEGTYENIDQGVLASRGIVHFFTEQEFVKTISETGFNSIKVDTMQYTDNGAVVEMFMAKAEK